MRTRAWAMMLLAGVLGVGGGACEQKDAPAPGPSSANPSQQGGDDDDGAGNGKPAAPATTRAARPRRGTDQPEPPFWEALVSKGPVKPDLAVARVLQVVEGFDHPLSVTLAHEGNALFVTNSAMTSAGAAHNAGSISKLEVQPDGRLKMLQPRFVTGLHAPMGIAPLTKETKRFPVGTLFVCVGATTGLDAQGEPMTDIKRFDPAVIMIDPATGKQLGKIPLGPGSPVAKDVFHPILTPHGSSFDGVGNLYVADTSTTGYGLEPPINGRPGIIRIKHKDIDAFAEGKGGGVVSYLPVRHEPAGVYWSPFDDGLYWTTSSGKGGGGQAVYRMPRGEFPAENMVENVIGDIGALEGLQITPNKTLVMSRADGDLAYITRKRIDYVRFDEPFSFNMPGDFKLVTLRNGYNVAYVPEQDPSSTDAGKQRVWVILLPSSL